MRREDRLKFQLDSFQALQFEQFLPQIDRGRYTFSNFRGPCRRLIFSMGGLGVRGYTGTHMKSSRTTQG
jgi:hypothetical protein